MRHGDRTINDVVRMLDAAAGVEFQPVNFGDDTLGQHEVARKALGDNWQALVSGQVSVERVNDVLQLKIKEKTSKPSGLFNRHGFRIVPRGLKANTTKPNTGYNFTPQPLMSIFSYEERLARIVKYLGVGQFISAQDFANRSSAILKAIEGDEATAKLLKGVALPFVLPQMNVNWSFAGKPVEQTVEDEKKDLGIVIEEFVDAAGKSYTDQFQRPFTNHRKGDLAGQTTIVEGSRHERLIEAVNKGVVVGVYFPNCLQGFSVHADREQMSSLPEQFLLGGALEAAACYIAYPDVLGRDGNTPLLDLAAMEWRSSDDSLCFYASDDGADFDYGTYLGEARDDYAGGLVVLG